MCLCSLCEPHGFVRSSCASLCLSVLVWQRSFAHPLERTARWVTDDVLVDLSTDILVRSPPKPCLRSAICSHAALLSLPRLRCDLLRHSHRGKERLPSTTFQPCRQSECRSDDDSVVWMTHGVRRMQLRSPPLLPFRFASHMKSKGLLRSRRSLRRSHWCTSLRISDTSIASDPSIPCTSVVGFKGCVEGTYVVFFVSDPATMAVGTVRRLSTWPRNKQFAVGGPHLHGTVFKKF